MISNSRAVKLPVITMNNLGIIGGALVGIGLLIDKSKKFNSSTPDKTNYSAEEDYYPAEAKAIPLSPRRNNYYNVYGSTYSLQESINGGLEAFGRMPKETTAIVLKQSPIAVLMRMNPHLIESKCEAIFNTLPKIMQQQMLIDFDDGTETDDIALKDCIPLSSVGTESGLTNETHIQIARDYLTVKINKHMVSDFYDEYEKYLSTTINEPISTQSPSQPSALAPKGYVTLSPVMTEIKQMSTEQKWVQLLPPQFFISPTAGQYQVVTRLFNSDMIDALNRKNIHFTESQLNDIGYVYALYNKVKRYGSGIIGISSIRTQWSAWNAKYGTAIQVSLNAKAPTQTITNPYWLNQQPDILMRNIKRLLKKQPKDLKFWEIQNGEYGALEQSWSNLFLTMESYDSYLYNLRAAEEQISQGTISWQFPSGNLKRMKYHKVTAQKVKSTYGYKARNRVKVYDMPTNLPSYANMAKVIEPIFAKVKAFTSMEYKKYDTANVSGDTLALRKLKKLLPKIVNMVVKDITNHTSIFRADDSAKIEIVTNGVATDNGVYYTNTIPKSNDRYAHDTATNPTETFNRWAMWTNEEYQEISRERLGHKNIKYHVRFNPAMMSLARDVLPRWKHPANQKPTDSLKNVEYAMNPETRVQSIADGIQAGKYDGYDVEQQQDMITAQKKLFADQKEGFKTYRQGALRNQQNCYGVLATIWGTQGITDKMVIKEFLKAGISVSTGANYLDLFATCLYMNALTIIWNENTKKTNDILNMSKQYANNVISNNNKLLATLSRIDSQEPTKAEQKIINNAKPLMYGFDNLGFIY